MVPNVRLLPRILARCHTVCGWICFRLGLSRQARRHYEHVLRLRGDDFSSYVHLGRISYDAGDYAGWRREFEHARRADPGRFARLSHPFELFEPRLAGTAFDAAGERATWRSMRPLGAAAARRSGGPHRSGGRRDNTHPDFADTADGVDASAAFGEPSTASSDSAMENHRDDCSDPAERTRLHGLGPVRRAEWSKCDLDELARRLSH